MTVEDNGLGENSGWDGIVEDRVDDEGFVDHDKDDVFAQAWAFYQDPAYYCSKPKLHEAKPKPGLLSQAGPCTSLLASETLRVAAGWSLNVPLGSDSAICHMHDNQPLLKGWAEFAPGRRPLIGLK